jgi:alpha-L-rhamnosidase
MIHLILRLGVLLTMPVSNPPAGPGAPANLRCEYLVDPLAVQSPHPRLSWEVNDPRRGAVQTAYQIVVASAEDLLEPGKADLWDTGKVASAATAQIAYAGKPLTSRLRCYWRVRTWDGDDQPSPWSRTVSWGVGLLEPSDWRAEWIGHPAEVPAFKPALNGFHTEFAKSADEEKWVTIDLGRARTIDGVRFFPARPYDWPDTPGFLYPVRFRVEIAEDPEFAGATSVVDLTGADVPNPGAEARTCRFTPVSGRYVRLTATRLAERDPGNFAMALAELQVLSGENMISVGAPVYASDSIESGSWAMANLVDGELVSCGPTGEDPLPPPILRKEFRIDGKVARATAYVSALGLYELHINGSKVGDQVLAPEFTDYMQHIEYQTYDVTDLLKEGENAIGALMGDGWYCGHIGLTIPGGPSRRIFGPKPCLMAQIEIELEDGSTQVVTTDASWHGTMGGPLRLTDLFDGETYDALTELPGWDRPGFDDSEWTAVERADYSGELVAQPNQPIRVTEEIKPVGVTEPKPGMYVFDLGQNMVGWCRITAEGEPGTTVTLRHAEVLNPDGTIYTENIREADQTDRFTLSDSRQTFEPRFTYHGFRYVEVTGLDEKPELIGRVVHSDSPRTGTFECSDPMLNRLMLNALWTQRGNMHSIPTDCPQRGERMGWMGDIQAFCQTAIFNLDMAAFFTKWVRDIREAQADDGRFSDFSPNPYNPNVRGSGAPAWADAGTVVPWTAYVNYGDMRMLEEHFDAARRWVDFVQSKNPDLIWRNERRNDYNDWLNGDTVRIEGYPKTGGNMPNEAFATAFFAHSTDLVSRMAAALGREKDAKKYRNLHGRIKAAFNKEFVAPDGRIKGDTQAGYALALVFNLVPEKLREAAVSHMVQSLEPYGGRLSTGIQTAHRFLFGLLSGGRVDEAYRLLLSREAPSWGYMVDHGATTIWERWDGYIEGRGYQDPGMDSFNHYAFGSVGEWIWRNVAGINPDEQKPGYEHFTIRPVLGGGLTWAKGEYHSIRGKIVSSWRIEDGKLELDVTVPANTTATVYVPAADASAVTEGGKPAAQSPGVEFLRVEGGFAVFTVPAGEYRFESAR